MHRSVLRHAWIAVPLTLAACETTEPLPMVEPTGVPVLGAGTHDLSRVRVTVMATVDDGLENPTDLGIPQDQPGSLWITNHTASGITILRGLDGSEERGSRNVRGAPGSLHFMRSPAALAFGVPGRFATAQDTDERTQSFTDSDFMGPTLWTSDPNEFEGGAESHYDMLHNSPNSVGIAWERDNVYWIADGYHGALTRYDFLNDHGPGGDDHSDGIIERHLEGVIGYVEGVPGHLDLDTATMRIVIADPAHGRVLWVDASSGARVGMVDDNYDLAEAYFMEGTDFDVLADSSTMAPMGMTQPSGVAIAGPITYVSDFATSHLYAFDTATGGLLDWIDLSRDYPSAGLSGLAWDATQARLYVTAKNLDLVLSIEANAAL